MLKLRASLVLILLCLNLLPAVFVQPIFAADDAAVKPASPKIEEDFVSARVLSVSKADINQALKQNVGIISDQQMVKVEILEGPLAGTVLDLPNQLTDNPAYNIVPTPGRELILSVVTQNGGKAQIDIADYKRSTVIGWLFAAFLALFLFFGGKQGIKSLAGLVVCAGLIVFVLLPLSLKGFNPLITAIGVCLVATATSMGFVAGFTKKSLAAVLGTVGGFIVSGVASQIVIAMAPLTGLTSEDAQILRGSVLVQPPQFYSGLLAAGMLIGALGVIMDVGISIASSVWEVSEAGGNLSKKVLYERGMNVGRDIMGTMTNTLVLAYAGSALPLLMLVAYMPSIKLLNLDLVATEVAAALSGSLGLICTIPLTAYAASCLMSAPTKTAAGACADLSAGISSGISAGSSAGGSNSVNDSAHDHEPVSDEALKNLGAVSQQGKQL